jgi:hypothetical protein
VTGAWRTIADRLRRRQPRSGAHPPTFRARLENEIAQLQSIRDDALRCTPGSPLHSWINGAIFTLSWVSGEANAQSPSWAASWMRTGQKVEPRP